jgi:hypothetical protein
MSLTGRIANHIDARMKRCARSLPSALLPLLLVGCPSPSTDGPNPEPDGVTIQLDGDPQPDAEPDSEPDQGPGPQPDAEPDSEPDAEPDPALAAGADLYAQHCANCHGADAAGFTAPNLIGWDTGRDALIMRIDTTMPPGSADVCVGACATSIADWLLSLDAPYVHSCEPDEVELPPQSLRLLTRRELNASIAHLLADLEPACSQMSACDLGSESCTEGRCRADACATHAVVFDPGGASYQSVHLAGTFNGWAPTVAEGGIPLTWDAAAGRWIAKVELDDGEHQYKLVLDESTWISDPGNPQTAPDGFGGQQSVVNKACANAPPPRRLDVSFTSAVPPESRPAEYPFDNHAASGAVSTTWIETWGASARALAAWAEEDLGRLLPCAETSPNAACANIFVDTVVARAYRRAPTSGERARLLAIIDAAPSFAEGVGQAFEVVLLSPHFLYRSEIGTGSGEVLTLTQDEIASVLSFSLTGSPPDDQLRAAAAAGQLTDPDVRATHAERLLGTDAAREAMGRFGMMWLGADGVFTAAKSPSFNALTDDVRGSMAEATERFFVKLLLDDSGTVRDVIAADWSLYDDTLLSFYGPSSGGTGSSGNFAVGDFPDEGRKGILGHGSILATNAYPDQTSPVRRGLFIRQRILCQEFGVPPANAGAIPEIDPNGTTRERFEQHATDPACASCHVYIDDLGFGFEHYDPIGRWRDTDNGLPIDDSGLLRDVEHFGDGTAAPFEGVAELADLIADSHRAKACFMTQALRFGTGELYSAESCATQQLVAGVDVENDPMRELFIAIVKSELFITRARAEEGVSP